jgi:hypothetical protein
MNTAKTAQQWVTELTKGTSQAYPNIKRSDMVAGLQARLVTPWIIDQRPASLCGPACLMYCLASLKNALYAQYVVDLYQFGQAFLGKLSVVPSMECRKYAAVVASKRIHPVDWVALASLRDSENGRTHGFNYDDPDDEFSGTTLPGKLVDWFKACGFTHDADYTNFVVNKDVNCIRAAGNRFDQHHTVCLLIDGDLIQGAADPIPHIANHWVVLTHPVIIRGGRIKTSVYSWGTFKPIDLPIDTFCNKFYGYVSAFPRQ